MKETRLEFPYQYMHYKGCNRTYFTTQSGNEIIPLPVFKWTNWLLKFSSQMPSKVSPLIKYRRTGECSFIDSSTLLLIKTSHLFF